MYWHKYYPEGNGGGGKKKPSVIRRRKRYLHLWNWNIKVTNIDFELTTRKRKKKKKINNDNLKKIFILQTNNNWKIIGKEIELNDANETMKMRQQQKRVKVDIEKRLKVIWLFLTLPPPTTFSLQFSSS